MSPDLRDAVELDLGEKLTDSAWNFLVSEGFVEDMFVTEKDVAWLAKEARKLKQAFAPSPQMNPTVSEQSSAYLTRLDVISELLAQAARTDELLLRFRAKYLSNGLMSSTVVPSWIADRWAEDGAFNWWIEVPIPHEAKFEPDLGGGIKFEPSVELSSVPPPYRIGTKDLEYRDQDGRPRKLATKTGSPLAQLRDISQSLSKRFHWTPEQAVSFILTDKPPALSQARLSVSMNLLIPSVYSITLEVDPSLTPHELADIYSRTRAKIVGSRSRPLSQKHLKLALFVAKEDDGSTWPSRMSRWNEAYPNDRYDRASNFARDANAALRRITQADYHMPGIRYETSKSHEKL